MKLAAYICCFGGGARSTVFKLRYYYGKRKGNGKNAHKGKDEFEEGLIEYLLHGSSIARPF